MSDTVSTWRKPPNQNLIRRAAHWPVVGEAEPLSREEPWVVRVDGAVASVTDWSLAALREHPSFGPRRIDIHCVTRWSKLDCAFSGVRLMDVIEAARPTDDAVSVRFVAHTERDHDTTLSLADIQRHDPIIALDYDGLPLPPEHGGPVRIVTPGKYFYKSCKWVARIELLTEHSLGYWESGPGYHDGADPWREERYITGSISPEIRDRMIAQRRFGGRDLLSCVFDGEDLEGLDANGSTLRNASFKNARLRGANFAGCYMANARMGGADLREASFANADAMGVDYRRADLRGADFTDAQIFGAGFCDDDAQAGNGARFDASTRLSEAQISTLTDLQATYVRNALKTVE